MRIHHLMIGLLVLATVLEDCAAVGAHFQLDRGSGGAILRFLLDLLLPGLVLSQISLMAIWLALGWPSGPWRFLGTGGVLFAWVLVLKRVYRADNAESIVYLGILTACITAPLLVARLRGLRVVGPSDALDAGSLPTGAGRFQFSILYLLGWMTALAITLGLVNCLALPREFARVQLWQLPVLFVLLAHSAVALVAMWAVLRPRRPRAFVAGMALLSPYLAGVVMLCLLLGFVWMQFNSPGAGLLDRATMLLQFLPATVLLIASLAVFRVAGYRLRWCESHCCVDREPPPTEPRVE